MVLSDLEPTPATTPSAIPTVTTSPTEQSEYVYNLDEDYRDDQGIYYKTYKMTDTTGIAYVGDSSSSCGYTGASEGHVIIPDKVVKDGIEYTVTKLAQGCFSSNEHLVSIQLPKR